VPFVEISGKGLLYLPDKFRKISPFLAEFFIFLISKVNIIPIPVGKSSKLKFRKRAMLAP
jgi:hypothetical protein